MKKFVLLTAVALAGLSVPAFAHEDDYRYGDQPSRYSHAYHRGDVRYEVHHVNGMLAHVERQISRYGGGWRVRAEVRHISGEVSHVNWEYRHGDFDSWHIRREIQHIHGELHAVEQRLQFRESDYYRWD